ncbi:MAG: CvpA family protein [Alistipes sp.]|nr:CvpA family protein [Alistipes sp.]
MFFFDIITVAVICWMIYKGKNDGIVSQLFSLAGIALGVILGISFGLEVGSLFGLDAQYAKIVGFIIIFIAAIIVANILANLISDALSFIKLKWLDSLLGIFFAVVKGVVVLGLLYTAIFALNKHLKLIDSKEFSKSISFNFACKSAKPLLNYWDIVTKDL